MDSKNLLIVLACFCLCFCPAVAEEGPILPMSTWVIRNNNYFNKNLLRYSDNAPSHDEEELEKYVTSYAFPEEIDSGNPWYATTLTDGREIWPVVFLWLKNDYVYPEPFDLMKLQGKVLSHPIIQAAFADHAGNDRPQVVLQVGDNLLETSAAEQFQIALKQHWSLLYAAKAYTSDTDTATMLSSFSWLASKPSLIVVPESFPFERIKAFQLASQWSALLDRAPFALLTEYPGRILLPELPPEEEDEPPFVKLVRESRKDGKISPEESMLFGLRWENDTWELFAESVATEGTEKGEERKRWSSYTQPFQVGGFCSGSEGYDTTWRIVPEISCSDNFFTVLSLGTTLPTPEERKKDNSNYRTRLSLSISTDPLEGDNVFSNGSFHCTYPNQPEGVEPREGIATAETLDALNRSLTENVLGLLVALRSSAMSTGGEEPIDFAAQFDKDVIYAALAFPPGLKPVDWNSFQKVFDVASEHAFLPRLDEEGKALEKRIPQFHLSPNSETGEGFFCVALGDFENGEEIDIAAKSEYLLSELKQKVQRSRDLQEEGMPTPITLLRGNSEGWRFSLENETIERKRSIAGKLERIRSTMFTPWPGNSG